ncbi:hypothetical protein F5Y07DRAFT_252872 [Xylaria sp. FL0933]|nr:hypothetical protein F5Y07DRAFT_252872 [Xylaria sp. FL0933]
MPVQFIDNASIDKKTRTLIRSHVAKGKNLGRTVHRPSRHSKSLNAVTSVIVPEDASSGEGPKASHTENIEVSVAIQKQFQEDLSTSLPFHASWTSRRLFYQFANFMHLNPFAPELQKTIIHVKGPRLFLQYAFIDEAFFHCVVAMSVWAFMSFSPTRQEAAEALSHLSRSLRLVNQRLAENGNLALSDTTLAVVIAMTQHERLLGCHRDALIHFEGCQRMIELRGGIAKLVSECPAVAQKVFRADFDFALQFGSPTRFGVNIIPGTTTLEWLREKYKATRADSPYTPVLAICVDEKYQTVFEDMCVLAWLVNDHTVHGITIKDYDFHEVLLLIGYRLLDVRPLNTPTEASEKLESLLHLGLAALMTKFFFTLDLKPPDVDLLRRRFVSATLKQWYADRDGQELLLWLLFTGKVTVSPDLSEDIWLVPKISQVATQLSLSTWHHVLRILQKFPWVGSFSSDAAQALWSQICSLDAMKHPLS